VKEKLGSRMQVMNCNGKMSSFSNRVGFDLIIFGSEQKGKVQVHSEFNKAHQSWDLKGMDLYLRKEALKIL